MTRIQKLSITLLAVSCVFLGSQLPQEPTYVMDSRVVWIPVCAIPLIEF